MDDALFPEQTTVGKRKAYRVKPVSEPVTVSEPSLPPEPQFFEPVQSLEPSIGEQNTGLTGKLDAGGRSALSLSRRAVVQGIIMSEILQPPRAKRPFRHG